MYGQLLAGSHALAAANRTAVALGASHALAAVARHTLVGSHRLSAMDQPQKDVASAGFYLSGGTTNTDPDDAIGGQVSSEPFQFQSFILKSPLPGVTIKRIGNSGVGVGVLVYEPWGSQYVFRWIPKGSDAAFGRIISGDGEYGILTANGVGTGFAVVDISFDSLTPGLVSAEVDVRNIIPNIFSSLTSGQAETGYTSYRCIYLKNEHATDTMTGLTLQTFKDGDTGSVVEVAVDTAGAGDGVSTGVAATPANETTTPGFTFGSSTALSDLLPGQYQAVWLKRTIYEGWHKELDPDVHLLLLTGGF